MVEYLRTARVDSSDTSNNLNPDWQHEQNSCGEDDLPDDLKQHIVQLRNKIENLTTLDEKVFLVLKTKFKLAEFNLEWQVLSKPTGFGDIRITIKITYRGMVYVICEFIVNTPEERQAVDDLTDEDLLVKIGNEKTDDDSKSSLFF